MVTSAAGAAHAAQSCSVVRPRCTAHPPQFRIWGISEGSSLNPSEIGTQRHCPSPAMTPEGQAMSFLDQQLVLMRCVHGSEQLVNPES